MPDQKTNSFVVQESHLIESPLILIVCLGWLGFVKYSILKDFRQT